MDRASLIGIVLGISAIAGGSIAEGGKLSAILQPTAAVIVFGGTLGATLLSVSFSDIMKAISALKDVFSGKTMDAEMIISSLVKYSIVARRKGLIALEHEISEIKDDFLRDAMRLAINGMGVKMLRETLEQNNITYGEEKKRIAKVFETAGGFAPTIGIIGAVIGLIHVMENLSDPSKLGSGIAVAFVATVYGVGSANLILLPISKKLINRLSHEIARREMIIEGVVGIQSGINPYDLEEKLRVFIEKKD
jgi:chemotaxis protein MotA